MNTQSNPPPESPKCCFAAQLIPMAQHFATNPWGDYLAVGLEWWEDLK